MTDESSLQPDKPEEPGGSFMSHMPSYPAEADFRERMEALVCEECEEPRPGMGKYTILYITFLCLFIHIRRVSVFRCPRCMRSYLLECLPLGLVLANVLSPIVLLWWGVQFARTFGRGKE